MQKSSFDEYFKKELRFKSLLESGSFLKFCKSFLKFKRNSFESFEGTQLKFCKVCQPRP